MSFVTLRCGRIEAQTGLSSVFEIDDNGNE
jgi:hypothetical protein